MSMISLELSVASAQTPGVEGALTAAITVILVGLALFKGWRRIQSSRRGEPAEDELSRLVTARAASLAYYVSIYFWLFMMYMSNRTSLESHTLIGAGIGGMAVIFLASWIWVKAFGPNHE